MSDQNEVYSKRPTFWQVFFRQPMGTIGFLMILFSVFVAVFAPYIAPYDPKTKVSVTIDDLYQKPGTEHLLGTDDGGKDVLTNLIYGTRVSLLVGVVAAVISVVVGGVVGIMAGFYGGRVENILMRITDFLLVIPGLPLQIVIVAMTRPSLPNIILVIGLLGWTSSARLVRAQTLAVKQKKYVLRARSIGSSNIHIIIKHIVPIVFPLIAANTILMLANAILSESTLSFLGLGDPLMLSWGQMLSFAWTRNAVTVGAWWALLPPGFGIVWIVLGATLLGNGLEQIFNPRMEVHQLSVGKEMVARDPKKEDENQPARKEVSYE
jgi:peptide/nickel transport system permease protein